MAPVFAHGKTFIASLDGRTYDPPVPPEAKQRNKPSIVNYTLTLYDISNPSVGWQWVDFNDFGIDINLEAYTEMVVVPSIGSRQEDAIVLRGIRYDGTPTAVVVRIQPSVNEGGYQEVTAQTLPLPARVGDEMSITTAVDPRGGVVFYNSNNDSMQGYVSIRGMNLTPPMYRITRSSQYSDIIPLGITLDTVNEQPDPSTFKYVYAEKELNGVTRIFSANPYWSQVFPLAELPNNADIDSLKSLGPDGKLYVNADTLGSWTMYEEAQDQQPPQGRNNYLPLIINDGQTPETPETETPEPTPGPPVTPPDVVTK